MHSTLSSQTGAECPAGAPQTPGVTMSRLLHGVQLMSEAFIVLVNRAFGGVVVMRYMASSNAQNFSSLWPRPELSVYTRPLVVRRCVWEVLARACILCR